MADGFLGRWSKRKAGKEISEVDPSEKKQSAAKESSQPSPIEIASEEAPPPVTLDDVAKIDRFDPDFSAFMRPDVDPVVQQAALKKMFTDPHFNIMDGLDIYIDDYSKPDPLPPGMLERMVQSDMLNLFRKSSEEVSRQDDANSSIPQSEGDTLDAQEQSALTSTQQIDAISTSESSDKVPNEVPVNQEHKKT